MEGMEEAQRQLWKKTGVQAPSAKLQDRWRTPPNVFQGAQELVSAPFLLDAAATADDTLCTSWIELEHNALDPRPWLLNRTADTEDRDLASFCQTAWCNPPYSNHPQSSQYLWAQRCHLAASRGWTVALLIPAAPTTRCGQLCAMTAHEIHYTAGRIAFLHPDSGKPVTGNPLGSQLVIFRPHQEVHSVSSAVAASAPPTLQVFYGWSP